MQTSSSALAALVRTLPRAPAEHEQQEVFVDATTAALRDLDCHHPLDILFVNERIPHADLDPTTLQQLKTLARQSLVAAPSDGLALLQQTLYDYAERPNKHKDHSRWTTTLPELDEVLEGGWEQGEMVEVAGAKQSGRTTLVLTTVLRSLLFNSDRRAVLLHTTPTFDARRCLVILQALISQAREEQQTMFEIEGVQQDDQKVAISVLDRLSVVRPFTSQQALEAIQAEVERNEAETVATLSFVVVDSIGALLGGEALSNPSAQGHAQLVSFMRQLTTLAQSPTLPLTVFLINSAVTTPFTLVPPPISILPITQSLKPSLGATFTHLTDLTLWLTRAETIWGTREGKDKFVVELARNRRGEARGWTVFELIDGVKIRPVVP